MEHSYRIDAERPARRKQRRSDRDAHQKTNRSGIASRIKVAHPIQHLSQQLRERRRRSYSSQQTQQHRPKELPQYRHGCAPRAMRIAISFVRSETAYATNPTSPSAASDNATSPSMLITVAATSTPFVALRNSPLSN